MTLPSGALLERTIDEAACVRLCVDFANHIDARRYGELLDLFADDGTLDRLGVAMTGRAAIERFLVSRPTDVVTRHLCTNIRIEFDGPSEDEARGQCYALFYQGAAFGDAARGPPAVVEYHDRFRRTAEGWKIQRRQILMAFRAA